MFFNPNSVVLLILGIAFLVLAKPIGNFMFRHASGSWFDTPLRRNFFFFWPGRVIGIMCLTFAILIALSGPTQSSLKKSRNQLLLLEKGVLNKAVVSKVVYQRIAPAGWEVIYKFEARDPITREVRAYIGSSQGPKRYYVGLSKGDNITVIYDPCMPKLNCEIRCFLNDPVYRHTFKKTGKLNLLDRYRDTFEIEEYTFEEWYRQQQQK